ncbi:unnamed protein product [Closterium sp. NIES-53]
MIRAGPAAVGEALAGRAKARAEEEADLGKRCQEGETGGSAGWGVRGEGTTRGAAESGDFGTATLRDLGKYKAASALGDLRPPSPVLPPIAAAAAAALAVTPPPVP